MNRKSIQLGPSLSFLEKGSDGLISVNMKFHIRWWKRTSTLIKVIERMHELFNFFCRVT